MYVYGYLRKSKTHEIHQLNGGPMTADQARRFAERMIQFGYVIVEICKQRTA